jgi:hypothetical protein
MYKKTLLSLVAIVTIALTSFGQAPEGFKYQAVVRDAGNLILNNQEVGMQMTIQQGSIAGTTVYQETFAPTTNTYGLVNLEIGSGTVVGGTFATIDWSAGPYFIETAVDITGGTSYVVMGTSQLMSVPYALHAKTAENVTNDTDTQLDSTGISVLGFVAGSHTDSTAIANMGFATSSCALSIGQTYQGGIIFYIDSSGCHGLISAEEDQTTVTRLRWYAGTNGVTRATGDGLYAGETNTAIIIASQVSIGDDGSDYAAQICNDLQITEGGVTYGDWYLPSKYEINLLFLQQNMVGGFVWGEYYWSSTESGASTAWLKNSNWGGPSNAKDYPALVRAIRAF